MRKLVLLTLCLIVLIVSACGYSGPASNDSYHGVMKDPVNRIQIQFRCGQTDREFVHYDDCRLTVQPYEEGQADGAAG